MKKWYNEIDWKKCVDSDTALIIETIGIDNFIPLTEKMEKATYYFAKMNLWRIKKEFIVQNAGQYSRKELRRKLNCSARFIRKVLQTERQKRKKIVSFDKI